MKTKTITKDTKAVLIAIVISVIYLIACGLRTYAAENGAFVYPNGRMAASYSKPDALNSKGSFESNGVFITATDLYFLYDFCK